MWAWNYRREIVELANTGSTGYRRHPMTEILFQGPYTADAITAAELGALISKLAAQV